MRASDAYPAFSSSPFHSMAELLTETETITYRYSEADSAHFLTRESRRPVLIAYCLTKQHIMRLDGTVG